MRVLEPARHNGFNSLPELLVRPTRKADFSAHCEVLPLELHTSTVRVELEQDFATSEDEQIAVFRDDAIDVSFLLQVSQLGVSLVRCNYV